MITGTYNNVVIDKIKVPIENSEDRYNEKDYELLASNVPARKIETVNLVKDREGNEVISDVELRISPDIIRLPTNTKIKIKGEEEYNEVVTSEIVTGIKKPALQKVYL